jgi:hypothetical protein
LIFAGASITKRVRERKHPEPGGPVQQTELVAIMTAILRSAHETAFAIARTNPAGPVPPSKNFDDLAMEAWGLYYAAMKTATKGAEKYGDSRNW